MSEALATTCDTIQFLKKTFLWSGLGDEELSLLASAFRKKTYRPGEAIIRYNQPGRRFHMLLSGSVEIRVPEGQESILLTVLPAGECFGEMSLLTGDPTSADVIAAENCETLALSHEDFGQLVSQNSNLLQDFIKVLAQRLRTADAFMGSAQLRQRELARFLAEADRETPELIGSSLRKVRRQIETQSRSEEPLFVRGEAGTGKELTARLVHAGSSRRDEIPFSAECAQVTESAWGDRLFGSYSGAVSQPGAPILLSYMEIAGKGTLVLRNIENLPLAIQGRLADFLEKQASGSLTGPRVIATGSHDLQTLAREGQFDPCLAGLLCQSQLEIPPLRERKRDIPDLVTHFLTKHATHLARPVSSIDDSALKKLVCYDYAFGNVAELEKAIERAVMLADGSQIQPEEIFLAPPPPPQPAGYNLLRLPSSLVSFLTRKLPRIGAASALLVFLYIFYDCFFGPLPPRTNLGHTLVWAIWWPVLVLSFFFVGRAWCAVCPMSLAGSRIEGWKRDKLRIPSWLKKNDSTIIMAGFFGIVWMEEAVDLRHSPRATGFLLLAILTGAVLLSLLFPRRTWCRHVCPLGAFAGVSSSTALLELRPTFDICSAKCEGHSCFKGDSGVGGCPMFNHVMFVDSNRHCVLCMNCVQSCPNDSPQLNLRLPGRELWSQSEIWKESSPFVALLLGLLAGMSLLQAMESWTGTWLHWGLQSHRFLVASMVLVLSTAATLLWAAWRSSVQRKIRAESGLPWSQQTGAFVPLLLAGFVAYQLAYIPGVAWLQTGVSYAAPDGLVSGLEVSLLPLLRIPLLVLGLAGSLIVLWKVTRPGLKLSRKVSERTWTLGEILFLWAWLMALLVVS